VARRRESPDRLVALVPQSVQPTSEFDIVVRRPVRIAIVAHELQQPDRYRAFQMQPWRIRFGCAGLLAGARQQHVFPGCIQPLQFGKVDEIGFIRLHPALVHRFFTEAGGILDRVEQDFGNAFKIKYV
jgi:hypothetical protein